MGKIISEEAFIMKINEKHPFAKIKILNFDGLSKPLKYKCLKCENIEEISKAELLYSRINICKCHKDFYSREEKIRYFEKQQNDLEVIEIKRTRSKIRCKKCGIIFDRTTVSLMSRFDNCPNCNDRFKKQTNSIEQANEKLKSIFNSEYNLIDYTTFHGNCKIECKNCHFIYNGRFDSFLNSLGCPRCKRKMSKGEQKINTFLKNKNINFIRQKSLDLEKEFKKYKFDFYLPDYNTAIEYNGEQHYIDKKRVFDDLKTTKERDEKKKIYCKKYDINLLIIPYWDLENIETILSSKFND